MHDRFPIGTSVGKQKYRIQLFVCKLYYLMHV